MLVIHILHSRAQYCKQLNLAIIPVHRLFGAIGSKFSCKLTDTFDGFDSFSNRVTFSDSLASIAIAIAFHCLLSTSSSNYDLQSASNSSTTFTCVSKAFKADIGT